MAILLSIIAQKIGAALPAGAENISIERISSFEGADAHSITFISRPDMLQKTSECSACAFIVKPGISIPGKICLEVKDPYLGYALTAQLFEDTRPIFGQGIHASAIIDSGAVIHPTANIGPGTVIGSGCRVGAGTTIGAHCVLEPDVCVGTDCRIDSGAVIRNKCSIGNRVEIHSNAVVGSAGFANAMDNGTWARIPCFGAVIIEDDVHIGAGTMIDRGNFESTIIRKGSRLDNLVHIAHNVEIGEHTAMAAQVGISGSTKVGKHVIIGGQAGFVGHIHIGDGSFIGAKAGVSKDVGPNEKVTGYPARDFMKTRRVEAVMQDLPAMHREVKLLRKEVDALNHKD